MSDGSQIEKNNPYEINEIESKRTPQKQSTWENILEYFESYIKPYTPYRDEPTYKALISFIIKYYTDLIYNVQPEIFKDMFERQTIRTEVIDLLLISIGLPEKLVKSITTTSKFIILKSFSDFERYQGTVKFFRSVGGAFYDKVSFYELYIDYDSSIVNPTEKYFMCVDKDNIPPGSFFLISSTYKRYYVWFNCDRTNSDPKLEDRVGVEIRYTNESTSEDIAQLIVDGLIQTDEFYASMTATPDIINIQLVEHGPVIEPFSPGSTSLYIAIETKGKPDGAWILRPRPIFVHPKLEKLTEVFDYQAAYNKIPTLLVPEEQLEELRKADEIVFPTKSNIILMNYVYTIEASIFNTLIFTILMKRIGEDLFTIHLTGSNEKTAITYNVVVYTWYYLLARYYGVTLEGVSIVNGLINGHIVLGTNKETEYSIDDLPMIENEYNNIKTRNDLVRFYNKYYVSQFGRYYEVEKPTIQSMRETLRTMDYSFSEYIENRVENAENQEQDIRFLLDELYASIVLSFNKDEYRKNDILSRYLPILLQFITQITTNMKVTDSYKLIYNLKPFHTELLDLAFNNIEINDKFNALLFDDYKKIFYTLVLADLLHMSDEVLFSFTPKKDGDSLSLNDYAVPNTRLQYDFDINVNDSQFLSFLRPVIDRISISDQVSFKTILNKEIKHNIEDNISVEKE